MRTLPAYEVVDHPEAAYLARDLETGEEAIVLTTWVRRKREEER